MFYKTQDLLISDFLIVLKMRDFPRLLNGFSERYFSLFNCCTKLLSEIRLGRKRRRKEGNTEMTFMNHKLLPFISLITNYTLFHISWTTFNSNRSQLGITSLGTRK